MKLVVIESPYGTNPDGSRADAATVARRLEYLRACMADCIRRGEAPYASHGLYTQPGVLRDEVPAERETGMKAGFAWGDKASLRAVYLDEGVTPGMVRGVHRAKKLGQPVEERRLQGWPESRPAAAGE